MDIEREIDLIEEIARVFGYGRIPTTMPDTAFPGKQSDRQDVFRGRVREIMAGCGLNEMQTYSMLGPKDFEMTGIAMERTVKIANPLTVEESIMRTHVLPGLLKAAAYNQNRQIDNVLIFEIGKVFSPSGEKLPKEKWVLGGLAIGSPFMSVLDKGEVDYFYIKGILENLFRELGVKFPKLSDTTNFLLQPGKAAQMEKIGFFGGLHPDIQRNYGLIKPVLFFEIDLDALYEIMPKGKKYRSLPKFPSVSRDISMFIPQGLENQAIVDLVKSTGAGLVEEIFPFDKYKDSIAYRIVYRRSEKTLTEEEVNAKHREIVEALKQQLMVRIR